MIMNIVAVTPIFTNSVIQKESDWIKALKLTCTLISYSTAMAMAVTVVVKLYETNTCLACLAILNLGLE